MKIAKLNMAESIENSKFSTRLRTALKNMASLPINKIHNLDEALEAYRRDPVEFQAMFLRLPGAGRISLDEFIVYAEGLSGDGDYTGRTYAMPFDEAAEMQDALAAVCNHMSDRDPHYAALRKLQHLLDASTIHLEQLEDQRSMFHRKAAA